MLTSAHQGYIYQDVLGAYFVAQELAKGRSTTAFHFDHKKTPRGIPDKFDDLVIYQGNKTILLQIKYSNDANQHVLTKQDFSSSGPYDLALYDLFKTWKALHRSGFSWRVSLAWDRPVSGDPICNVLISLPDQISFFSGTTCYQFDCDALWPEGSEVLSSWSALKRQSVSIDRKLFKSFLECLVIEVGYPKSTLLKDYSQGLEKLLAHTVEMIGIGVYPNDHLTVRQVVESLCTIINRRRSTANNQPVSCQEIAQEIGIIQSYGGVEQHFPIDETVLVATPERVDQVVEILEEYRAVVLTAEPGAGKSWFIDNLEKHLQGSTQIVKHYCYTALEDALSVKRITVNVLYGSLITQIVQSDEDLRSFKTKRYASNLEELNLLLRKIEKKTLLIVDGIDHIWRVYQKNRGGITEDETTILKALAQLDFSNPNVSFLIVSQPIEQLSQLTTFYPCTLATLPESFVEKLLEKNAIPNSEVKEVSLSHMIHEKSCGNALYCKYLIDYALAYKAHTFFDWINSLPPYQFNLTGYYQYLYEQIQRDSRVPYALCGADFSLTEEELKKVTHLGNGVTTQLSQLRPVLKFKAAFGYTIYHESFKRFAINTIKDSGASIEHLIYRPLIEWLETQPFFESTKAYGHLLKLYYEVDSHDKIAKTISVDFVDNSLYYAQPFQNIYQNHSLQRAVLQHVEGFVPMIVMAEQSKMIYQLENLSVDVLVSYLKAVQGIHGEEFMYRALWDGEHLLVGKNEVLRFLVQQAYAGESVVHWSIVTFPTGTSYEMLGLAAAKLLYTKQYKKFDELIKRVYESPEHRNAFGTILNEIEWWIIYFGDDWISNTPYFHHVFTISEPAVSTIEQAVNRIISNERFVFDSDWRVMVHDVVALTKTATQNELESAIESLSHYNWFRNWLIYLIKITELSQRNYTHEEIINAFTYLIRDLSPFKGDPRVSDLYPQLHFIKRTFHQGLLLCNGDKQLLTSCCELLERVTEVTTSFQRSFSGPLTDEEYLELIANYLPGEYVVAKYEQYFGPLGSRRVYSNVAEIAFQYTYVLTKSGSKKEAQAKYKEGIQALTAYGERKDRTLSEILYCSVPYQQTYGTLNIEWFYELYYMAMTVVTHTDGKSTNSYPIEWFEEFIKVYPTNALQFLVSETLENSQARWHQEDEFYHLLEECHSLFTPTQWFLLCRSLPLASSDKIIDYGLAIFDQIDVNLQQVYGRWLQSQSNVLRDEKESGYSLEVASRFKERFGFSLKTKEEKADLPNQHETEIQKFPTTSLEEVLAFLEENNLTQQHAQALLELITSTSNWSEIKTILRQVARSFRYKHSPENWIDHLFEPGSRSWLYFNVCLFVFIVDGWLHGLHNTRYLKKAYDVNAVETLAMLKEVLADFLSGDTYTGLVSCNLIKALSELHVEEAQIQDLLNTIFQIVKRRLPHPPNSEINKSIYNGLEEFNRDEMIVALLIARLKTLSTEKNQGIIWALTYIAQTRPETLIKPYYWVFSNNTFLLPIQRAVLLQILDEYVDQSLIPDNLIGQFIKTYPTGFFLEDQYIRSFVDYNIELDETSARVILNKAHIYDDGFFPSIHVKYRTLEKYFGPLTGTLNAYQYKRDEIIKKHESYYMRSEKVLTPIVSLANASYEIANSQFYKHLKGFTDYYHTSFTCNLGFFLSEIILQIGTLTRRPSSIPDSIAFPPFEVRDSSIPLEYDGWSILAVNENEISGEHFKQKNNISSSLVLTIGEKPKSTKELYAKYIFRVESYFDGQLEDVPLDLPICRLEIIDTLEHCNLTYVSPYVIKGLGLIINPDLHTGFQALNSSGEVIIKMITWKERYYGSVSDGTEVPIREGVAVMVRSDYYERLLGLYKDKHWFVLTQRNIAGSDEE